MEKNVGTIEPGKLADIAVLSADPLEVDDDAMRDVRSCLTIVGGKVVHRDGL
jgi:predicted amidohydrolase YtcJ